ncbi:MAG: UbiA family prenyltransferase [Nocardioides sp.]|uniref:UbiA family prenyltransferase n=1 Tax=Nocardioides sp. TaxID=35761 RepID=UPI0039E281E5
MTDALSTPVTDIPLVVDLDGTLIATDLLYEAGSASLIGSPASALHMAGWLKRGRSTLKRELTARVELDYAVLPFRHEVIEWLRAERAAGRRLILASASDRHAVQGVADHLGLFDEVFGSTPESNLRSEAKRDLLVERFGPRGFDYVGNSSHDLPVWEAARVAHVVSDSASLRAKAAERAELGRTFGPGRRRGPLRAWLKSIRIHQWSKNALVVLPLLLAHRLGHVDDIVSALVAFVSFSLTASSVYVLNDLADVENDRHHHKKRTRPFAAGDLSLAAGWVSWPLLALAGLGLAFLLPLPYLAVLLTYLTLTTLYTFALKQLPVVDVVTLALLYTLRIVAGSAALDLALSNWLLTFSMFIFLGLAMTKRVSELTRIRRELSGAAKGRGYVEADLELLSMVGVSSSIASVLTFALFVQDGTTIGLYKTPGALWMSVPVLLGWLLRVWLLAHRGELDEDPILFAIKDRVSLVLGAVVGVIFLFAMLVAV